MPPSGRVVHITDPCRTRPRECVALHLQAALLAGANLPRLPAHRFSRRTGFPQVPGEEIQAVVAAGIGRVRIPAKVGA